jgi:crotonobetainyl-CoA:carnitine CoA-transferase CaiB-like acyl-CoA transferase
MDLGELTVVEFGEYVAVPYAGKLFSDLGADVIKLEPPAGDVARYIGPFVDDDPSPDNSEFFGYLNTGKRSVAIPPNCSSQRRLLCDIIAEFDVDLLLESSLAECGIDPEALDDEFPQLSVISLSGFGATGPWQEYEAPDFVGWAESGHMNKMGYPDSPPIRPQIKTVDFWAGQACVISGLGALLNRDIQGGTGQFVDVSKREAAVSTMDRFIAGYSWSGATSERSGGGYPKHDGQPPSQTIYQTKDGYISVRVKWDEFCTEFLDRPELAEDDRFSTRAARNENNKEVTQIIEEYTSQFEKWELFEKFQEGGIAAGITATPADVFEFDHLHERDFWQETPVPSGSMVTMPGFPFRPGGPEQPVTMNRAPRLGEHTAEVYEAIGYDESFVIETAGQDDGYQKVSKGTSADYDDPEDYPMISRPLEGVKVLDFTWVYAGPHTTKYLAALGADVVKVESKQKPDSTRLSACYGMETHETASVSASYNERNQGKRSMQLDLTNERGRELALELMKEADVVVENYSPDFMSRIDLDYGRIKQANPEIVYLSMPGMASSGPAKNYRAYGMTIQSMIGLDYLSGFPDDPPTTTGHSWPDPTAGYMGILSVLFGLYHREQSGEGLMIELPQFEMATSLMFKPLMEYANNDRIAKRTADRDEDNRYVQGVYPAQGDDSWVVVGIETTTQWRSLCHVIEQPELASDERFASHYDRLQHHDEIDEIIQDWTRDRAKEEVRDRLQTKGVPAGIVADERDLMEYDPQLRARDYFTTQQTAEVGERRFQGVPFRMSESNVGFATRAPTFGEHTTEVLTDWLGYTDAEIQGLEDENALY